MPSTMDLAARLSAVVAVQQEILLAVTRTESVLDRVVRRTAEITECPSAAIELFEENNLVCRAGCGGASNAVGGPLMLSCSLSAQVLRERKVLQCDSVEMDTRVDTAACRTAGVRSILAAPLLKGNVTLGVLSAFAAFPNAFTDLDGYTLQLLAGMTAAALVQARTFEALQASEERYRLLFEQNVAGVFRSTRDGRILDCNDALVAYLGYASRDELLAQPSWDLYQQRTDREALVARLEREHGMTNVRLPLKRKDGTPVIGLVNISIIPAGQGEPQLLGTMVEAQPDE